MRNIFITLIVLLCTMQSIIAQDVLITTDGDVMTVYIDDIGSSTIYYKSANSENSSLQRIDKSKVYMIKKADGTKIDLSDTQSSVKQATTPTAPPLSDEISDEAKQRNTELITSINSFVPEYVDKYGKEAKRVFCVLGIDENSCINNDDVEIFMKIVKAEYKSSFTINTKYSTADPLLILTIKNKTQNMLYLDLGNTFFVSGENAVAYYIPSATSTATSNSTGVSVNAGAITGAMGIGGTVGQLANGVNVGGGSSSTTVSVTYSQRVIAVPPLSTKTLDGQHLFYEEGWFCDGLQIVDMANNVPKYPVFYFRNQKGDRELAMGDVIMYSQTSSPIHFSVIITYSNTEDCTQTKRITSSLFLKNIIGINKFTGSPYCCNPKVYIPNCDDCIYFVGMNWDAPCSSCSVFPRQ